MPPPKSPQPSADEARALIAPIQDAIQGGSTLDDQGDYSPWAQNPSPY